MATSSSASPTLPISGFNINSEPILRDHYDINARYDCSAFEGNDVDTNINQQSEDYQNIWKAIDNHEALFSDVEYEEEPQLVWFIGV